MGTKKLKHESVSPFQADLQKHLPNILYHTEIIINGSDTWLLVNVRNACDNDMGIS